jgi:hypothetical protein
VFLRLFVLVLCLAFISVAHAHIDAMQLRLLESYSQGLRWDNIESAPAWVNGVKPEYHDDWEMHRVRLAPKQQVTVFLPAYESLRLYHPKQTLDNKELDIYASSGTGLAVKQNLQLSSDGHSLVLSPHSATPLLVHITRKCCRAGDVDAALFVSRKVPLGEIAPYRNLVWSSARWCWLGQEPFTLPELYKQLPAKKKQHFDLAGPARIAIKNRLHYEQYAGELIQDYLIRYWLDDDKKAQELGFSTSVETGRVITVDGSIEVVGREEQAYLEIPAGRHRLVLQADRPLYVQLLAQTEHDYLFRSLNNPRLPVESIRNQGLLTTTELVQQAQTAKRIAQDNSRKEGGQVASNLLREAALKREDYPAGLTEAEHLRTTRSFYRDLLPSKKADLGTQFMAYFLTETLQPINRPSRDTILADQHLAEALKRVSQAYFTPLTKAGSAGANEYTLPEQQTDGFLRLIIDKRNCVSGFLHIQIDQQITKDLWLRCQPDLESEAFTRSLADIALMRLQQEPDSFNASLEVPFSTYSEPAQLIATAVYEVPFPKSTRTLKLWQVSKPTKPVNVAIQYRASKAFSLSEQGYLARLRDSSGKHVLTRMIENITSTNDNPNQKLSARPPAEQQLANEWLPLQRLLQTEYRLYKSSVSSYPAAQAATVDQQVIDNEMALSKNAEAQQLWLEALEHWGKVVNYSKGLVRQQAQLYQAHVLSKLGEDYLAESLRRYLSLFADASVAEQAITELSDSYQSQNNTTALLTLAAAMSIQRPTAAHSQLLVNALLKNGEYRFALLLGLSLDEQIPSEGLLAAAYQLEWWEAYQRLQDKLPPDRRAFWLGLKAQHHGDYNAALKAWSGVKLKPWHDYLQQGLSLRDRLTRITGQNAQTLYGQWSTWQQQHPGTKTWQNALWHVKDYAGSDTYYAVERDVYAQAVRGTLQRPVVLGIMGPVTLNLQIRPLHPTDQPDVAFDGWLQIIDNDVPYHYPYTNNLTSQGLKVTEADNLQVGSAVNLVYQVGQGWHEIKLNSEQAPLSIGIQEQRPELALSVLPPLKTDTFAEMGFISRSHNTHPANK